MMAQTVISDKCHLCKSEEKVQFFCTSCKEILCANCKVGHANSKKTKNDRIIPLVEARNYGIAHTLETVLCCEHSSEEVTLFCLQCDQLVCKQCLAGEHNTHPVTLPNNIQESKTKELKKLIKILKEKKAVLEKAFDTEGKVHSQFSRSIDRVKKDISDQKAKIIEELDLVCNEQFSEIKTIQQNENERYSDACSKIQVQNQAVTKEIQTAQTSVASGNSTVIIQAIVDATQTLHGIEEPAMPPTTVATYEPGDRSHPKVQQVQGKINIKRMTTAPYHAGDSSHPTTYEPEDQSHPKVHQVQGDIYTQQMTTAPYQPGDGIHPTTSNTKVDVQIQQGATPKLKTDVKVKRPKQKTSNDNKQQRQEKNKCGIDMSRVGIKSTVKVKGKNYTYTIIPLQDKTAWVQTDFDHFLTHIDNKGQIITKSVSLPNDIRDAKQYTNGLLAICQDHCKIHSLSTDGKLTSTFSDLSPFKTMGLCVTQERDVMVCLQYSTNKDKKVVRLNEKGRIIQTIQHTDAGDPLYQDPSRVTVLTTGEVIVIDGEKIVGVDREGRFLFTWEGNIQGRKRDKYSLERITNDGDNNLFVTDGNHGVLVLSKDGSGAMCLLGSKQGIACPHGLAVGKTGQLWVSCKGGNIHIIEYWQWDNVWGPK